MNAPIGAEYNQAMPRLFHQDFAIIRFAVIGISMKALPFLYGAEPQLNLTEAWLIWYGSRQVIYYDGIDM